MTIRSLSQPIDKQRKRIGRWTCTTAVLLGFLTLGWAGMQAMAQTGGTGSIAGTVLDPSGSAIAGATVTATDNATGVKTTAATTGTGAFVLRLLPPGVYTVVAGARGFQQFAQESVVVDALQVVTVNPKLAIGVATQSVVVSSQPSMLMTQDVQLGSSVENETYDALPLAMNASARDPTAFAGLTVGVNSWSVQPAGPSTGSFSGGQTYQNETYIGGLPLTSAGTESETRNLAFGISVEAVNQFQVATTGSEAAYSGQGVSNYVIKSGTNQFHGGVFEYFRNTVFDARNFFSATVPIEHQNEFGGLLGGPIIHNKLFFFVNYDGYRYDSAIAPSFQSIPTLAERSGDFSAFGSAYPVYDPLNCLSTNTNGSCNKRQQFSYNGELNVIPPGRLSSVSKSFASYLPQPTNNNLLNNYLATLPNLVNNDSVTTNIDYNMSSKNRVSVLYSWGKYSNPIVGSLSGGTSTLPIPYTDGRGVNETSTTAQIHDVYTINANMVNSFGYGLSRLWIPLTSNTQSGNYPSKAGLAGLPAGIASEGFPDIGFSGNDSPISWDGTNSHAFNEAQTTFTVQDNLMWTWRRNRFVLGIQWQAEQDNENTPLTGTQAGFTFSSAESSNFTSSGAVNTSTGLAYASYMLGEVSSSVVTQNAVAETGGRYKTTAPYFQDDIQITPNLTVNLGLRWNAWSPFTEVHNHMSFFNPTIANPVAGNHLGALEFAGSGEDSCHCNTPVETHWKNWAPRFGVAYKLDKNTVVRSSYGIYYAHAGGVGGRGNGRQGLSQIGFDNSGSLSGVITGQGAYYDPNSTSPTNGSWDNGYPGNPINPPFINPSYGIGYISSSAPGAAAIGAGPSTAQGLPYADPTHAGIAPRYQDWTLNVQHSLSPNMTLSVAYVGTVGHHLPGAGVASQFTNQIPLQYLPLGSLLTDTWNPATVAAAQAIFPNISSTPPFPFFASTATLAQALRPYPQYSGIGNPWLSVGNSAYNALQVSFNRRMSHGLTFMANYTFSKELDNLAGARYPGENRLEWSPGSIDRTHVVTGTFVYQLPFGTSHRLNGGNPVVRSVISGWQFSGIFQADSGAPMGIGGTCTTGGILGCDVNYNPSFTGSVWQNGKPKTVHAATTTAYLNSKAFTNPPPYTTGNVSRTAPDGLYAPHTVDVDLSVRREFPIRESIKFSLQADSFNITNSVFFSAPNATLSSSSFGSFTSQANQARKWQFSGRLTF